MMPPPFQEGTVYGFVAVLVEPLARNPEIIRSIHGDAVGTATDTHSIVLDAALLGV
jgi:hypothetical protein